jgi:aerobic-type carbon monoxide dehydrogenase small subunit (CoxS/CutS family)
MRLRVNDREVEVRPAPGERLLATLHDQIHLSGAKFGCGQGECGACTVLVDGRLTYSCITLTEACEGATVSTIEGMANGDRLSPLQRAFIAHDAAQCGYCTPGQLIAAAHLLQTHPEPTEEQIREGMSGNLCRCGTYPKIIAAIQAVARGQFREPTANPEATSAS